MIDISKRIEELSDRQKELVIEAHNLRETVDQLKQVEKEIAWIAGALNALRAWEKELPATVPAASSDLVKTASVSD